MERRNDMTGVVGHTYYAICVIPRARPEIIGLVMNGSPMVK